MSDRTAVIDKLNDISKRCDDWLCDENAGYDKALDLISSLMNETAQLAQALSRLPESRPTPPRTCPTCGSPSPLLHPAMQHEGEVQPCRDEWHFRDTPENGKQYRAIAEKLQAAESRPTPGSELEMKYRNLLWLGHGHIIGLYGDDGEMQCSECRVDYRRDPLPRCEVAANTAQMKRVADALAAPASVGAGTPPREDPLANVLYAHVYRGAPPQELGICSKHSYSFAEYETSCPYCVADAAAPVPPMGAPTQEGNPLQHELLDLITLMPDAQTQELIDYIMDLRRIRSVALPETERPTP